jgi:polyhydroxybutyrate depolymerase
MRRLGILSLEVVAIVVFACAGCDELSGQGYSPYSAGSSAAGGTGGMGAAGGAYYATGGAYAFAGAAGAMAGTGVTGGTGGAGVVAGAGGTGGAGVVAGAGGTAGADAGTGGAAATGGGTAGADAGTGGAAATGGGTAGADAGTGGAAATGGSGGTAGADAGTGGNDPITSSGCGAADWPDSGDFSMDVDGTNRTYIVELPNGYDSGQPYRLIFAWHYLGGTASGIASGGYYGLQSRAGDTAIFVSAQGIDNAWPNTNGRDVAFATQMLDWMKSNYCIDEGRIFSVGFSYGGIMSNTVGCALGDQFRAIAPMSGMGPRGSCVGQVAAWISHGESDGTVSFSSGQGSRDHWVEANHCSSSSTTVGSCVAYEGCDAGYPVHWCQFAGGHTRPSFAPDAIWEFFSQF